MAKNQDVVLDKALTGLGWSLRLHFSIKRDVLTVKRDSARRLTDRQAGDTRSGPLDHL